MYIYTYMQLHVNVVNLKLICTLLSKELSLYICTCTHVHIFKVMYMQSPINTCTLLSLHFDNTHTHHLVNVYLFELLKLFWGDILVLHADSERKKNKMISFGRLYNLNGQRWVLHASPSCKKKCKEYCRMTYSYKNSLYSQPQNYNVVTMYSIIINIIIKPSTNGATLSTTRCMEQCCTMYMYVKKNCYKQHLTTCCKRAFLFNATSCMQH